jgi:hypothetical protein
MTGKCPMDHGYSYISRSSALLHSGMVCKNLNAVSGLLVSD